MPEKCDIMHAIREGLDEIRPERAWGITEWTQAVKDTLYNIGHHRFGYHVGMTKGDLVCEVDKDQPTPGPGGEFLYDVVWLEYGEDDRVRPSYDLRHALLVDAPLVAECQWGPIAGFTSNPHDWGAKKDFEKLLLSRAGIRLMICDKSHWLGSAAVAKQFAKCVRAFNGSRPEDTWLLAIRTQTDIQPEVFGYFTYFTLDMNGWKEFS